MQAMFCRCHCLRQEVYELGVEVALTSMHLALFKARELNEENQILQITCKHHVDKYEMQRWGDNESSFW